MSMGVSEEIREPLLGGPSIANSLLKNSQGDDEEGHARCRASRTNIKIESIYFLKMSNR